MNAGVFKSLTIKVAILFLLCGQAPAETFHIRNWPSDLNKVPCSAWRINPDGTVTQTGTIVSDNPPITFTRNTFTSDRVETKIVKNLCRET
jgi:hypothetical protein